MSDAHIEHRNDSEMRERIAVLETQINSVLKRQDLMVIDLRVIRDTLAEARGGWKVMIMIGGTAGVAGAFITKILGSVAGLLPK